MASRPQAAARRPSSGGFNLSLNNPDVRAILYQIVVVGAVAFGVWYLISNTMANLETRKIATGFGFLGREAGLPIGEAIVAYSPADTYLRALYVGLLNTLRVAVLGIVLATVLGTIIGIARLSRNWLVAQTARVYVEVMRNLPLLLQLLFWWTLFRDMFPGPRDATNPFAWLCLFGECLTDVSPFDSYFLSNRGIKFPVLAWQGEHTIVLATMLLGIIATWALAAWARKRQALTGQQFPIIRSAFGLILGVPLVVFVASGAPIEFDKPVLRGFNFVGGGTLTPEFAALLIGLVLYTAAFIGEIVRSGILAVSHGQTEAALALGLKRGLVLRLVVLPQALRVIVPPTTSQYLNLTKNSSLAVAIGYPDIVSVANTTLNQTGQAIEGIAIIMLVYLTISLSISLFMNWYNKHIALVER
jgi:general L-amino acid transport system permease protein